VTDRTAARRLPPKSKAKLSFGQVHFGAAELGDARRTQRLVYTADKIMRHPGGTLPQKLKDWSDLMGLYRLVKSDRVTHAAVIAAHCRRTLELAAAHDGVVLLVHDATELNYSHLPSLAEQLGQVGSGRGGRGYICHNTLAVTAQEGEVLGLAHQVLHRRRHVPKGESPAAKRDHPQRESRLWLAGCEATAATTTTAANGAAAGSPLWVDVADRGADTFELLDHCHRHGRHYVIRSARDRRLDNRDWDHAGAEGERVHQFLHAYTRDLPTLGERTVQVPRRQRQRSGGRKTARAAHTARVRIAAGPVTLRVPDFARGQCSSPSLDLWVVHVREVVDPSSPVGSGSGDEPLEWVLLTNVPAATFEAACQRVDWYARRPMIEEFHKGMKSGCGVELPQFEHADRLEPVIGLLSVVTVALLRLRLLTRAKALNGVTTTAASAARPDNATATPATAVGVPPLFVRVLAGWRYQHARDDLSAEEFAMALGKLGGHLNRKGDGPPGWLTLWRGWQELCLMVQGAEAVRCV